LIERVVRNDEVVGLIPICSTIPVSTGCGAALGRCLKEMDLHHGLGTEGSVYITVFVF
jgi:hypothetical protein